MELSDPSSNTSKETFIPGAQPPSEIAGTQIGHPHRVAAGLPAQGRQSAHETTKQSPANRWLLAGTGVLMQLAFGAVYAWSVFLNPPQCVLDHVFAPGGALLFPARATGFRDTRHTGLCHP